MLYRSLYFIVGVFFIFSCELNSTKKETKVAAAINTIDKTGTSKSMQAPKMKNLDIDYCMGKFEPKSHEDFVAIPIKYADKVGMYMRADAYSAFEEMYTEAKKDGISIQIRSAARNFHYQKGIWERKWTGATKLSDGTDVSKDITAPIDKALKILEYSSMPGTSRHHWGTDIDLNAFNNEYFAKGEGRKMYDWLVVNASTYGFCQPYTPKGPIRPNGYNEEKWHWSYQPVSQEITDYAEEHMKNEVISGFLGSETAVEIDVVRKYVLGINGRFRH
ncbi:MAG: D-alanyl-D-alanine carboxypeptidase [Saprospiraceae bacterium]|jgi:D-alanyl-D-alanine carboxypeptidase|tara:strand:- start:911 stop:1735 length:825 start_codon:yes stop_codon:yes gene_type:complete